MTKPLGHSSVKYTPIKKTYILLLGLCIASLFLFYKETKAQLPLLPKTDTANKELIRQTNSSRGTFIMEKGETINILVGNVEFEHKGDLLFADSARLNITRNTVAAYHNVQVRQTDGTVAYADRLFYDGGTKNVELIGEVELNSGADYLWSDKINYNLNSQIGTYTTGGTMQSGNTVISSKSATYNAKSHDARFKGDVNVLDPEYEIVSADLGYNTNSRLVTFHGPSIINNDSSTLFTTKGTYDSEKEVARFENRSSIQSDGQYMEADTMDYDRKTGLGIGKGNVYLIDSTRNTTLYCELGIVNELTKQAMATRNPYARMVKDKDTMYYTADTFYTGLVQHLYPPDSIMTAQDSLFHTLDILKRAGDSGKILDSNLVHTLDSLNSIKHGTADSILTEDSVTGESYLIEPAAKDTTAIADIPDSIYSYRVIGEDQGREPADTSSGGTDSVIQELSMQELQPASYRDTSGLRYFTGYRNVVIYSDSFQGKCDSMFYSQKDSILQMHYSPVIWSRDGQITGDIIFAHIDSSSIQWVKIPRNGIIVNQSTEANEVMFDQIQGNTIWAYFSDNEMDSIIAVGNAQSIYYVKDDQDAYVGVSEASSANLHIAFFTDSTSERRIRKITYYKEFEQKMSPLQKINPHTIRLGRFIWRKDEQLGNLDAFFDEVYKKKAEQPLLKEGIKRQLGR